MLPHGRASAVGTGRLTLSGVGAAVALGWVAVPSAMVPATVAAVLVTGLVLAVGLTSRPTPRATRGREDAHEKEA